MASPNYQVGAHFEALFKGVLVAASKSIETFFAISTFPELRCSTTFHDGTTSWDFLNSK